MTEQGKEPGTDEIVNDTSVKEIHRIEAEVFSDAWSEKSLADTFSYDYNHYILIDSLGNICGTCIADGRIAGYVIYSLVCDEAELLRIAVSEKYRGMGYGKKLMSAFVDELQGKAGSIFLEVRAGNETAIGLYEAAGFETAGIRKKYYTQPDEDAVIMNKRLR